MSEIFLARTAAVCVATDPGLTGPVALIVWVIDPEYQAGFNKVGFKTTFMLHESSNTVLYYGENSLNYCL